MDSADCGRSRGPILARPVESIQVSAAGSKAEARGRRLLVLDSSYPYATIKALGLEQAVISRDLDGYFEHVVSANPFGDPNLPATDSGPVEIHALGPRHTFIQARHGRFPWLRRLWQANFLLSQLALFLALRSVVGRQRIDIVRAGDPLYVGLFGWALARSTGAHFAVRINANNDRIREATGRPIYPRLLRSVRLEKAIERFVLKRAALVAAPNQDNVDFAVANGANPQKTAIFPYGNLLALEHLEDPAKRALDPAVFQHLGIEPQRYLLCISRLKPLKFPDDAVRTLAAARNAGHDVTLVLAGEGEMRSSLERLAEQLGVRDKFLLPGDLDQHELGQLYANAAVVISPLTGRALSEAALGAAPIAAYDLDWQGDLIHSGESGELVPFRDQEALGAAVVKLLDDRGLAERLGEGARARALEMFDPDRMLANERAAYVALLQIPPA